MLSLALLLLFVGDEPKLPEGTWIDLSYSFGEDTIYWPTAGGFKLEVDFKGHTDGGYYYEANTFTSAEHGGTHLDAPIHFAENRMTAEELPLDKLIGAAVVVDVSEKALKDRDYLVSREDFEAWEREHGKLGSDVIVLIRTGYGQFWPDRKKYLGTDRLGPEAVKELHFPGIGPDGARFLTERKIKAVGLDTPSLDYGQSTGFEAHVILFEQNIPGFENVANLDKLPTKGFWVWALPMKIKDGSGGPLRIVALVP